ncbi:hypothetical protein Hamer_G026125, partial [Homarus americanus]
TSHHQPLQHLQNQSPPTTAASTEPVPTSFTGIYGSVPSTCIIYELRSPSTTAAASTKPVHPTTAASPETVPSTTAASTDEPVHQPLRHLQNRSHQPLRHLQNRSRQPLRHLQDQSINRIICKTVHQPPHLQNQSSTTAASAEPVPSTTASLYQNRSSTAAASTRSRSHQPLRHLQNQAGPINHCSICRDGHHLPAASTEQSHPATAHLQNRSINHHHLGSPIACIIYRARSPSTTTASAFRSINHCGICRPGPPTAHSIYRTSPINHCSIYRAGPINHCQPVPSTTAASTEPVPSPAASANRSILAASAEPVHQPAHLQRPVPSTAGIYRASPHLTTAASTATVPSNPAASAGQTSPINHCSIYRPVIGLCSILEPSAQPLQHLPEPVHQPLRHLQTGHINLCAGQSINHCSICRASPRSASARPRTSPINHCSIYKTGPSTASIWNRSHQPLQHLKNRVPSTSASTEPVPSTLCGTSEPVISLRHLNRSHQPCSIYRTSPINHCSIYRAVPSTAASEPVHQPHAHLNQSIFATAASAEPVPIPALRVYRPSHQPAASADGPSTTAASPEPRSHQPLHLRSGHRHCGITEPNRSISHCSIYQTVISHPASSATGPIACCALPNRSHQPLQHPRAGPSPRHLQNRSTNHCGIWSRSATTAASAGASPSTTAASCKNQSHQPAASGEQSIATAASTEPVPSTARCLQNPVINRSIQNRSSTTAASQELVPFNHCSIYRDWSHQPLASARPVHRPLRRLQTGHQPPRHLQNPVHQPLQHLQNQSHQPLQHLQNQSC